MPFLMRWRIMIRSFILFLNRRVTMIMCPFHIHHVAIDLPRMFTELIGRHQLPRTLFFNISFGVFFLLK